MSITRIVSSKLKQANPKLWNDLRDRLTFDDDPDAKRDADLAEWLQTHSPLEALAEWAGWEFGDPSWADAFALRLRVLLACDDQYILTADHDREVWLEGILGGEIDA